MTIKAELAVIPDEQVRPIVVKLGKVRRKKVKQLTKGRGPLLDEVADALAQVRDGMGDTARGRTLVPIVFIYRQKAKKRKGLGLPFGF